jgi:thioredoxin 1
MKQKILEISDKTFDKEVMQSSTPVLLAFGATWCGLCKITDNMIEDLAVQFEGRLKVCKMDVDKTSKRAEWKLKGVPAFFTYRAGKRRGELLGLVPKEQLLQIVEEILK